MSQAWEALWYPDDSHSPGASLALSAPPLALASVAFRGVVAVRTWLYEAGLARVHRAAGARVVSVGNLNVGGAGKTPAVIFLAKRLASRGRRTAVLSRGYGRRATEEVLLRAPERLVGALEAGDEPLLIARSAPGVLVLVGADRVRLAARAVEELGVESILLDDGMQHRRLARDVEIVVVDEAAGFGNGRLLPWGPLREPLSALGRADLIWLKVSSTGKRAELPRFSVPVVRAAHLPTGWLGPDGAPQPLDALRGNPVIALAALARPGGFERTLESVGARVIGRRYFADHHFFSAQEEAEVIELAERTKAVIATTEKDRVRLSPGFPTWVLRLGVELLDGAEHLDRAVGL